MNTNKLKLYHRDQEPLADNLQGEFIIYKFKVSRKRNSYWRRRVQARTADFRITWKSERKQKSAEKGN